MLDVGRCLSCRYNQITFLKMFSLEIIYVAMIIIMLYYLLSFPRAITEYTALNILISVLLLLSERSMYNLIVDIFF